MGEEVWVEMKSFEIVIWEIGREKEWENMTTG